MAILNEEVIDFFRKQGYVIVSTVDPEGRPHNSCKDILNITPEGQVYLLDLYHGHTSKNINNNPRVSIAAVDEHKFKGYCLKGRAISTVKEDLDQELLKAWEDRVTGRLTERLLKNIGGQKGHPGHPEFLLPKPKYLVVMQVEEVVDLAPGNIKQRSTNG